MLAVTMSANTFHLFPSLPSELQIQVLQEASLPDGQIIENYRMDNGGRYYPFLRMCVFVMLTVYTVENCPTANVPSFHERLRSEHRESRPAFTTRLNLMKTCVLGRKVAMEAWKKDLTEGRGAFARSPKRDLRQYIQHTIECNFEEEEEICMRGAAGEVDLIDAVFGHI